MDSSAVLVLLGSLAAVVAGLLGLHKRRVRGARHEGATAQHGRQVERAREELRRLDASDAETDRAVALEKRRIRDELAADLSSNRGERLEDLIAEARALRRVRP